MGDKVTDKCRDLGGEFKECIQGILQHFSFVEDIPVVGKKMARNGRKTDI